ncbi:MAG: hypothetical protein U9O98_04060 [Asgard group archaeon]|nr:hypothetical protein [Asgard group archaeon]
MNQKENLKYKKFITTHKAIIQKLFDRVIWSIIQPLIIPKNQEDYSHIKSEIQKQFFNILQIEKVSSRTKKQIIQNITQYLGDKDIIGDFIIGLLIDFSKSFQEDLLSKKNEQAILSSITKLINQQILMQFVDDFVIKTFSPVLMFSLKSLNDVKPALEAIKRVIIQLLQENISPEEAENKVQLLLQQNYHLPEESALLVSSIIRSIGSFAQKQGIDNFSIIAEEYLLPDHNLSTYQQLLKKLQTELEEPITHRDKITSIWIQTILEPATIGLTMAGKQKYQEFTKRCKQLFQLILDQSLTADDFEMRLQKLFEIYDSEDIEEFKPIQQAIVSSIRFIELARIDDPQLEILLNLYEEDLEYQKKRYI